MVRRFSEKSRLLGFCGLFFELLAMVLVFVGMPNVIEYDISPLRYNYNYAAPTGLLMFRPAGACSRMAPRRGLNYVHNLKAILEYP